MSLVELFLIAVGLSMDAFAVSICKGLNMTKLNLKNGFIISLFFGGFQALMPLIGWFVGFRFQKYIVKVDHWIAFVLLAFIGGQMIIESFKQEDQKIEQEDQLRLKQLLFLAVATSIDALAIGITFALLPGINIWISITMIGLTTFILTFAGIGIGFKFGNKYEQKAQIFGGIILVLLGIKILLEHLGIFAF